MSFKRRCVSVAGYFFDAIADPSASRFDFELPDRVGVVMDHERPNQPSCPMIIDRNEPLQTVGGCAFIHWKTLLSGESSIPSWRSMLMHWAR